jgi:6-phosphogluconolactonase/glucosamine-6-phosphate isomerase/deaminase
MMRVEVAEDATIAAGLAASIAAEALHEAAGKRRSAALVVSAGAVAALILVRLAAERLPWGDTHVFQVDEHMVARDDWERSLVA